MSLTSSVRMKQSCPCADGPGTVLSMASNLGSGLAALRALRGFTQAELGQRAGVDKASISRWERGQETPSGASVTKLLAALGAERRHLMIVVGLVDELRGEGAASAAPSADAPQPEAPGDPGSPDDEVALLARDAGAVVERALRLYFRGTTRPEAQAPRSSSKTA